MFNINYLTELDCYFLGLFYADGFVTGKTNNKYYCFGITISYKDKDFLLKIKDYFKEFNVKIKERVIKNVNKEYKAIGMYIYNVLFVQNIIKLGIVPNKTYENNSKVFDNIPDNLKRYFIKGFFDGDGTINQCRHGTKTSFGFVSMNNELLKKIKIFLEKECNILDFRFYIENNKHSRLLLGNKESIIKIRDFLYINDTFSLKRKKEKIFSIKKTEYLYPKGIRYYKKNKKFIAYSLLNHKKYIGSFSTIENAQIAQQKEIINE